MGPEMESPFLDGIQRTVVATPASTGVTAGKRFASSLSVRFELVAVAGPWTRPRPILFWSFALNPFGVVGLLSRGGGGRVVCVCGRIRF